MWLKALEDAKRQSDDGMTARELAEVWCVARQTVMKRLQSLSAAGKIRPGKKYIQTITGRTQMADCYKLVEVAPVRSRTLKGAA